MPAACERPVPNIGEGLREDAFLDAAGCAQLVLHTLLLDQPGLGCLQLAVGGDQLAVVRAQLGNDGIFGETHALYYLAQDLDGQAGLAAEQRVKVIAVDLQQLNLAARPATGGAHAAGKEQAHLTIVVAGPQCLQHTFGGVVHQARDLDLPLRNDREAFVGLTLLKDARTGRMDDLLPSLAEHMQLFVRKGRE